MNRLAVSMMLTAGTASAQNTAIIFQASTDLGQTWHDRVEAVPGETILVHMRVAVAAPSTVTVLGLAGITYQPHLTNWNPGTDTRLLFTRESEGAGVELFPQTNLGRIIPFAAAGMGPMSASGVLTSHVDAGNTLRFAGANAVTPTTNLVWGVANGQLPRLQDFFRTGTDVVVFRYGIQLGGDPGRTLRASLDREHVLLARANWYRTENGSNTLQAPLRSDLIFPAEILVIPAPPAALLIATALAMTTRTRRRVLLPLPEGGGGGVGSRLQGLSPTHITNLQEANA